MKILLTGAAGFIGMTTTLKLLARGDTVVGLDNLNDYYSVQLKRDRLARLTPHPNFRFVQLDVADRPGIEKLFADGGFDRVIHLAAQAGVRYSLVNPHAYVDSNVVGFMNILEGCRHARVQHLVYASSSSVYGGNTRMPFSEHDSVDHPVSMYAATKKANELMAHTYSHLFGLPTTGLRFFTVYGPWGRPDMALFLFTKAILEGRPIDVFNHGNSRCRCWTSSRPSRTPSAARPRRTCCRCRTATCRPPTPTSMRSPSGWASRRAPTSARASGASSSGTGATTRCEGPPGSPRPAPMRAGHQRMSVIRARSAATGTA